MDSGSSPEEDIDADEEESYGEKSLEEIKEDIGGMGHQSQEDDTAVRNAGLKSPPQLVTDPSGDRDQDAGERPVQRKFIDEFRSIDKLVTTNEQSSNEHIHQIHLLSPNYNNQPKAGKGNGRNGPAITE